jgi:hypothetical protein
MDKEQTEVMSEIVGQLIAIKYELSLYVDEGLIQLGESLENAINRLNRAIGTPESEPMPLGMGEELQTHSEPTESELPDKVLPIASEVQSAMGESAAATEIIDRLHWNFETLEAFFFTEHLAPEDTGEENENVADDRDRSVSQRTLQVGAILGEEHREDEAADD